MKDVRCKLHIRADPAGLFGRLWGKAAQWEPALPQMRLGKAAQWEGSAPDTAGEGSAVGTSPTPDTAAVLPGDEGQPMISPPLFPCNAARRKIN